MPAFHTLLPVRDEEDIIAQCLEHQLRWADAIYVFDTGSVDRTWEIVQEMALKEPRIIPLKSEPVFFSDNKVRGWMFHQARQKMRTGDWFLRADADEFHHIPPPEFVKSRLRKHETIVWHQYYDFVLRESEVSDWEIGRETLEDRAKPVEDRRQWFLPSVYSEPRLCRYRETMKWPPSGSFPINAGFVARERLQIRHYPHRDPVQLDRRCRLRAVMMADKENRSYWTEADSHHWAQSEWRKFITPDAAEGLTHWTPGTPLPEYRFQSHLARPPKRIVQWFAHRFLLPYLDKRRSSWSESDYPQRIPPLVVKQLREILSDDGNG